jgi:hypothetical protein
LLFIEQKISQFILSESEKKLLKGTGSGCLVVISGIVGKILVPPAPGFGLASIALSRFPFRFQGTWFPENRQPCFFNTHLTKIFFPAAPPPLFLTFISLSSHFQYI